MHWSSNPNPRKNENRRKTVCKHESGGSLPCEGKAEKRKMEAAPELAELTHRRRDPGVADLETEKTSGGEITKGKTKPVAQTQHRRQPDTGRTSAWEEQNRLRSSCKNQTRKTRITSQQAKRTCPFKSNKITIEL
jgi:hypothetical protein